MELTSLYKLMTRHGRFMGHMLLPLPGFDVYSCPCGWQLSGQIIRRWRVTKGAHGCF